MTQCPHILLSIEQLSATMERAPAYPDKTAATGPGTCRGAMQRDPMEFGVNDILVYLALFALVIAVIAVVVWLFKSMLSGTGSAAGGLLRGRGRRLGIQETASIDGRRRLILIRRDDVSHLIMTGGPVDVVIETGIQEVSTPKQPVPSEPVIERDADGNDEDN